VNGGQGPTEELTPAEKRLREHLDVLRANPPEPDPSLIERVGRAARWQRVVRTPLRAAGMLVAAVGEGVVVLLRGRARGRR